MSLAFLAYQKIKHPNPDWVVEVSTDLAIVLIVLGTAEAVLCSFCNSVSSLFHRIEKIKSKKI